MLGGLRFYPTAWMVVREQYRFPRSKKVRIRKKWRRDERNWRTVPDRRMYQMGNSIYAHQAVIDELIQKVERAEDGQTVFAKGFETI